MINTQIPNRKRITAAIGALYLPSSALLPAGMALAQDSRVVEEIIVTATRRSESLQEIPINISAVRGEDIERQGLGKLADISQWVAGIHVVDQGSRSGDQIIVRGLSADPLTSSEGVTNGGGSVATYVGEIPLYVDLTLNDMQRVEVLLGPQGTLYGAGTMGGAIRYIPNKPEFDNHEVTVRGDLYDLDESDGVGTDVGFTWNLPLSDTLALRTNVDLLNDPGFIDYVYTVRDIGVSDPDPDFSDPAAVAANLRRVEDVNDEDTLSARVALRWAPTDSVDMTLTYYLQDREAGGRTMNSRAALGTGDYESGLRVVEPNTRKNELLALELTADLGFAELTSATGYSEFEAFGQRDQTDLLISLEYGYEAFPTFTAFTREDEEEERINQEIRLVSTNDSKLSWIVGGFYNKSDLREDSKEFTPGYDEFVTGFDARPDNLEYFSVDKEELKEYAFFGELNYQLTDAWSVTLGARYYDYELNTASAVDFPLANTVFGGAPADQIILEFERDEQSDDGVLFKFNSAYNFTDDIMAYFTYSEGFRIGGGNGLGLCAPEIIEAQTNDDPSDDPDQSENCALPDEFAYSSDETKNHELGIRTTWLENRLTLNGALFYVDWADPQLSSTSEIALIPITVNGAGAESSGVELSFSWLALDNLSIRGSYSYTRAELTADAPNLVATIVPPGFSSVRFDGEDGDRLPGSPEHQGNVYLTYSGDMNGIDFALSYGVTAISDVISKTGSRANAVRLGGYAVHNLAINFNLDNWDLTFYADNLLNKYAETGVRRDPAYLQTLSDDAGGDVRVRSHFHNVLAPRQIGLRGTYRFDI